MPPEVSEVTCDDSTTGAEAPNQNDQEAGNGVQDSVDDAKQNPSDEGY
jgi:hypothetical protein